LCHLWHKSICDAAAFGNFHMHVHMLLYTEKIKRGGGASAVGALGADIATKRCDEGFWETLFDFIRRKN